MEAFALLKFWKTNNAKVAGTTAYDGGTAETTVAKSISDHISDESDNDDDDSFFELELTMPNYESKKKFNFNEERENHEVEMKKPMSKPQSPISILRSAPPKLRVFMFGKLNRKPKREDEFSETDSVLSSNFSPNRFYNKNDDLFTVKFRIEDGSIVPKFTRNDSFINEPVNNETSKRFSKDVVNKYLNRIKPSSYVKSSKKEKDEKFIGSPTRTSSFPSPRREKEQSSRFKVMKKCKSASSAIGAPVSFPARNDHPVDGIEGAILHCKRSLNSSSTGHSSLSRCSSDPSPREVNSSVRNTEEEK